MKEVLSLALIVIFSAACGQLITPAPTTRPATPTATESLRVTVLPTVTARPTATPKPATPAPTPTFTVTPTPIVYQVQPGDTLLAIAIAYNVPAEAIQVANGIVDPRSLQIDQLLIIPEPEDEAGDQLPPTPTPVPVTVQGVNFLRTPQGTLWCFGEVLNPGSATLSELVLEVNLYDAEGKLLASKATFTLLDVIASQQRAPFALLVENPPSSFAQYQVSAVSAVPLLGQTRYYLALTPIEVSATVAGASTYRISGQLQNTGPANAESIKLVVVAYDEAGKIVAQRQVSLEVVVLRSRARTPFAVDLTLPAESTVSRYVVQAQGLRAP